MLRLLQIFIHIHSGLSLPRLFYPLFTVFIHAGAWMDTHDPWMLFALRWVRHHATALRHGWQLYTAVRAHMVQLVVLVTHIGGAVEDVCMRSSVTG